MKKIVRSSGILIVLVVAWIFLVVLSPSTSQHDQPVRTRPAAETARLPLTSGQRGRCARTRPHPGYGRPAEPWIRQTLKKGKRVKAGTETWRNLLPNSALPKHHPGPADLISGSGQPGTRPE